MQPRKILDRFRKNLYLSRYYLLGLPRMPDGSFPFTEEGNYKDGAIERTVFGVAPYLHKIHLSDNADSLHNHPWRWAFSVILWRGYYEERLTSDLQVKRRRVWPFTINFLRGTDYHRLDLVQGRPAWTLFVVGPRVKNWGFWDSAARALVPWKVFLNGRARTESDVGEA